MKLVYHSLVASGARSPFAEAIEAIVSDGDVDVVGPYLTLSRLSEVTSSVESWRLVTDVEEWLRSDPAQADAVLEFLRRHDDRVRDCRGVHAKVVIGRKLALVGSANLTNAGLGRRVEMSVLVDASTMRAELQAWFDELWRQSSPTNLANARSFVAALAEPRLLAAAQEREATLRSAGLPSVGPRVESEPSIVRSSVLPAWLDSLDDAELARIGGRLLRLGNTREERDGALDVLRAAVIASGLEQTDKRLFVNVSAGDRRFIASVTVGNKYVATVGFFGRTPMIALTLSERSTKRPEIASIALRVDAGFAHREGLHLVWFRRDAFRALPSDVLDDWHQCIRDEVARSSTSSYRERWGDRREAFAVVMFDRARARATDAHRARAKR
jgi:hypothetical protein